MSVWSWISEMVSGSREDNLTKKESIGLEIASAKPPEQRRAIRYDIDAEGSDLKLSSGRARLAVNIKDNSVHGEHVKFEVKEHAGLKSAATSLAVPTAVGRAPFALIGRIHVGVGEKGLYFRQEDVEISMDGHKGLAKISKTNELTS